MFFTKNISVWIWAKNTNLINNSHINTEIFTTIQGNQFILLDIFSQGETTVCKLDLKKAEEAGANSGQCPTCKRKAHAIMRSSVRRLVDIQSSVGVQELVTAVADGRREEKFFHSFWCTQVHDGY
ncbi:MAG: hypothetical protein KME49_16780 [Brasilonema octagenarum HA4186-MV1]|uniref:Uncharacterized protein n=2 Tax=Brasilonema TaxID=383614 RepID=A0A856M782_9CYAN|nr:MULTISPECIES: hypothetical protein [Brasilonema]MBW4627110.1 hypothetical protein [Brasilonema octagenarum HA4186-MV1]NMF63847.1 hypothetical protein [Brasilonema octagenarum UFV-OR1]QDL06688.1 hypothetical protein DP114_01075 [Brasilonema sennae CENA114]QDL13056.1 hypothetical protein DP113_01065 [Brasilonema octagenarum UFV-E1]